MQRLPCLAVAALGLAGLGFVVVPPLLGGSAAGDTTSLSSATELTAPNVIFILVDDLGFGELSIQPGRTNEIQTPNIDALFRSGMRFHSAYANPVCAPSRASLFISKHTGHSPIRGNYLTPTGDMPLGPEDVTFLEALQAGKNYSITCIGKWGLGGPASTGAPWLHGCEKFYGVLDQYSAHENYPTTDNVVSYAAEDGLRQLSFPENDGATRDKCMAPGNNCTWVGDLWTEAALAELDEQAARQSNESAHNVSVAPFFLYWSITSPHAGTWQGEGNGFPVPTDGVFQNESWLCVEKDHASVIQEHHDMAVGRLMAKLEELDLRNNTVVMYASDNGATSEGDGYNISFFGSSGPLTGFKRWLADGGIRVPFAVSWPGVIPADTVSDEPVALWDVGPTLLSIAGVAEDLWPQDIDGVSLYEDLLLPGAPTANYSHPPLYWETCTRFRFYRVTRQDAGWSRAVRDGDWKAIWQFDSGSWSGAMLFNITADIAETTNLADLYPEVVEQMNAIANASHVDSAVFLRTDRCTPT